MEVDVTVSYSGLSGRRGPPARRNAHHPARPDHLRHPGADAGALDPGDRDYAVTLRLRTTHKFGNVIQKGQAKAYGGNVKMLHGNVGIGVRW